jgi:hypothetical protein
MFMTLYNMDLNQRSYFPVNKCIKIFEPEIRKNGNIGTMSWLKCSAKYSDRTGTLLKVCEKIFADIFNVTKRNPHSSGYAEKRRSRSKGYERATYWCTT